MAKKNEDRHGRAGTEEGLIPRHGGYRKLKTFQIAEVIYDVTVLFCDKFIDRRSRTHDQMVQAARSGRQNIAEGSVDSGTSKKIELKLTGIAKGSLEELRLDYEDFLRQNGLPKWAPDHPALERFKAKRCATLADFRVWVAEEATRNEKNTDGEKNTDQHGRTGGNTDGHGRTRTKIAGTKVQSAVSSGQCVSVVAANGALSLLNLCIYLLDRQVQALAAAFEKEGGFTERLYRRRMALRSGSPGVAP